MKKIIKALKEAIFAGLEDVPVAGKAIRTFLDALKEDTKEEVNHNVANKGVIASQSQSQSQGQIQSQSQSQFQQSQAQIQSKPVVSTAALISDRYRDNGDGTVTDVKTGLMWKRCSEGQTWDGKTCVGEAKEMTWNEIMPNEKQKYWPKFAGHDDWRVPTLEELKPLVYCSSGKPKLWNDTGNECEGEYQKPTIDQMAFPNTPSSWFWTATPSNTFGCSWIVSFYGGYVGSYGRYGYYFVRCVRAGQ